MTKAKMTLRLASCKWFRQIIFVLIWPKYLTGKLYLTMTLENISLKTVSGITLSDCDCACFWTQKADVWKYFATQQTADWQAAADQAQHSRN